ncbi:MAG TPA: hypothetical protein VGV88_11415 [Candidatus Dormibacteraeota bacterium]|nr:hypothetical protein [Candidatus Dormibacteraeota bacterium]
MAEFRVVVVRPEPTAGLAAKLQTSLEVNDDQGYALLSMVTYKDGLLVVFAKDDEDDLVQGSNQTTMS